jgi:threonine/homoserine/homoserine lactone efflux protein
MRRFVFSTTAGEGVTLIDLSRAAEFLLAVIAISIVPGPDTIYILSRSLSQGRRGGLAASLGSSMGMLGHITLGVIGISALIMASPAGFLTVRILGTCYLIYLGIRLLLQSDMPIGGHRLRKDTLRTVWLQGILTNLLNPKVAVFFLAFIPQFIEIQRGHVPLQFLTLGVVFDCIGTSWLCIVAISSSALSKWVHTHPVACTWQQRLTGAIFIVFAVRLALP